MCLIKLHTFTFLAQFASNEIDSLKNQIMRYYTSIKRSITYVHLFIYLFICSTFIQTLNISNPHAEHLATCVFSYCVCFHFLHCAILNVSSNCVPERKQSDIGCICSTFLHRAFSNVASNGLPEKMHSRIGCICLTFLHCVFSNVASNCLHEKMHSHIGCICSTFLHCAF